MATLRKDFDLSREYSVDVSNCSEEVKKLVQQAFFDIGFLWRVRGKKYINLGAEHYSNAFRNNAPSQYLLFGTKKEGSMTPKEFLDLVYEPEQEGHIHADLMAQYAEDAKTHDKPWKLWQFKIVDHEWRGLTSNPSFSAHLGYRRKPKTRIIHGIEVPDFEFLPKVGEYFYAANVGLPNFFEQGQRLSECCTFTQRMTEREIIYPLTEEGRQAAILHSKAMLGIVQH